MEKLITPVDVMERYGCSRQTARKYIRQCNPHMEKPLTTYGWAFREWELNRCVTTDESQVKPKWGKLLGAERVIVPRRR